MDYIIFKSKASLDGDKVIAHLARNISYHEIGHLFFFNILYIKANLDVLRN